MQTEFNRFTSASFEQFVQSLALTIFGPGLQVYGSGADGARDATFDGKADYPSGNGWDGYTVIQAKYREKPTEDQRDADWLIEQLEAEQKKFTSDERNLRKPEYYIISSNIKLSPIEGEKTVSGRKTRIGGLAKVESALRRFEKSVGCKTAHVWHRDKIERLIAIAPIELRRAYTAWLTPSDLLWEVLKTYQEPHFAELLVRAMAQNLRENQRTRLQEAGHSDAERTLLTQVFVDLPIGTGEIDLPSNSHKNYISALLDPIRKDYLKQGKNPDNIPQIKFVNTVLSYLSLKLDQGNEIDSVANGRIVLLGGPGQGKSTISQFLVQYFEAMFLLAKSGPSTSSEAKATAKRVLAAAIEEGINPGTPFRIPLRIILPIYADKCAVSRSEGIERISLLDFISEHFTNKCNTTVSSQTIRAWIRQHPWLIVLDGLDEVPATGERSTILIEIEALFDEIAAEQGDVAVIVTTRQQGYNKDLNPQFWQHWELTPLTASVSLQYAKKLSLVRLSEQQKQERVIKRLEEAGTSIATAQLMSSPLQVAILFTLVDLKGDVPTDRWSLFDRYFSVLRDREEGKGGTYGDMLKRHRTAVELIHHYAGFILQLSSERSGGANSFLTKEQFDNLVHQLLSQEGHESEELERLAAGLGKLATDRLVMLAQRVEGRIAFDVRSLQEFMAAAMVTAAKDSLVEERLRAIAAKSHWKHVVQIATSRFFAETGKRHLVDFIATLCTELDASPSEVGDRVARSGAFLALDLLADGIASEFPKHRKILYERALNLLELGASVFDKRLAHVTDRAVFPLAAGFIRNNISETSRKGGAVWRLLIELTKNNEQAIELMNDLIPQEDIKVLKIADYLDRDHLEKGVFSYKLKKSVIQLGFKEILGSFRAYTFFNYVMPKIESSPRKAVSIKYNGQILPYGTRYVPVGGASKDSRIKFSLDREKWRWAFLVDAFYESPNKETLSDALEACIDADIQAQASETLDYFPWPLSTILAMGLIEDNFLELAERSRRGEFGDFEDWISAERRWSNDGITIHDLEFIANTGQLFNQDIAYTGIPSGLHSLYVSKPQSRHIPGEFIAFVKNISETTSSSVGYELNRLISYIITSHNDDLNRISDLFVIMKGQSQFCRSLLNSFCEERYLKDTEIPLISDALTQMAPYDIAVTLQFLAYDGFDARVRNDNFRLALERFRSDKSLRGLIPFLLLMGALGALRVADFKENDIELFNQYEGDGNGVQFAALLIQAVLAMRFGMSIEKLISDAQNFLGNRPFDLIEEAIFRDLLAVGGQTPEARNRVAQIIDAMPRSAQSEAAIRELRKALDARLANFGQSKTWEFYGFPGYLSEIQTSLERK